MTPKVYLLTFLLVLLFDVYVFAKRKAQGKIGYEFNYSGDFKACDDPGEDVFDYASILIEKDSPTTTAMGGSFTLTQTIEMGTKLFYDVYKLSEGGKEPAWSLEILDICNHIGQENMPWSVVVDEMKLERRSCPIPAGEYAMDGVKLDMSAIMSTLTKDSVGEYEIWIKIKRIVGFPPKETLLSCLVTSYVIDEVRKSDD